MSRSRLSSYLRTERLRSGLSQQELGELLGMSRSAITKMEGARQPTVRLVFAAEIVFRRPSRDLFPGIYDALQDDILMRAIAMKYRLAERTDAISQRKHAHLCELINRLQFNQPLL